MLVWARPPSAAQRQRVERPSCPRERGRLRGYAFERPSIRRAIRRDDVRVKRARRRRQWPELGQRQLAAAATDRGELDHHAHGLAAPLLIVRRPEGGRERRQLGERNPGRRDIRHARVREGARESRPSSPTAAESSATMRAVFSTSVELTTSDAPIQLLSAEPVITRSDCLGSKPGHVTAVRVGFTGPPVQLPPAGDLRAGSSSPWRRRCRRRSA